VTVDQSRHNRVDDPRRRDVRALAPSR
jgi:hypothetical protein